MIWDGSTIYTVQNFKPETKWSVKWLKTSSGNFKGSDRGTSEDVFESSMKFRGTLADLTTLETELNSNRNTFSATFGTGEEIFGMDLDYSSPYTVSVIQYGRIQKVAFKVFEMPLKLRIISSPSFTGTAAITALRKASHSDQRESEYDITRVYTYDTDTFNFDHYSSSKQGAGIYRANFIQKNDEMKAIRRYLLTTARANSISMPSFDDMDYPFGTVAGTGPFTVKIIEWNDGGRINPLEWNLSITFARIF